VVTRTPRQGRPTGRPTDRRAIHLRRSLARRGAGASWHASAVIGLRVLCVLRGFDLRGIRSGR